MRPQKINGVILKGSGIAGGIAGGLPNNNKLLAKRLDNLSLNLDQPVSMVGGRMKVARKSKLVFK